MGDIRAFLLPPVDDTEKKVIITDRAKDEKGNIVPFVIRAISQEKNESLVRQATNKENVNGNIVERFNNERYGKLLVAAAVIEPDFKNAELCAYYKTMDPLDVPGKMLSSGEYALLVKAINELSGFNKKYEVLEEEAKN